MSQIPNPFGTNARSGPLSYESRADVTSVAQFFNTVYAWMASGLALTAVVAWWVSTQPQLMRQIFQGPVLIILVLAELGLVFAVSAGINRFSATTATVLFMIYSGLNGLTLSAIFVIYTKGSLASTFLVTAGTFGAMSVYGFVTKRDLTSLGSMLFMVLIGLILASLVNLFLHNETLYWIVTYAGVLIFVGLTAYDTQKLRNYAVQTSGDKEMSNRLAIYGALDLYLDFINLFLFLLRLMGNRK